MDINQAKTLKVGDLVALPADRGDAPFHGRVTHASETVCKNIHGAEFIWLTVRRLDGRPGGGVWPSNRVARS